MNWKSPGCPGTGWSLIISKPPTLMRGWSEGASGTLCRGANHALGPEVRETEGGDMAKPKGLWVWLLLHAKLVTQQISDNISEHQQCFVVCTDLPSTKNYCCCFISACQISCRISHEAHVNLELCVMGPLGHVVLGEPNWSTPVYTGIGAREKGR